MSGLFLGFVPAQPAVENLLRPGPGGADAAVAPEFFGIKVPAGAGIEGDIGEKFAEALLEGQPFFGVGIGVALVGLPQGGGQLKELVVLEGVWVAGIWLGVLGVIG